MRIATLSCAAYLTIMFPGLTMADDDGLRDVKVESYGVSVRVPQAWQLITWGRNDQAFVLKIPQQQTDSPVGYVACEVALAPESLEEYRTRHDAADQRQPEPGIPHRTLIDNRVESLDEATFGGELHRNVRHRLVTEWRYTGEDKSRWYEVRVRMISHDMLYTFVLSSDEAHYQAYRIEFDMMLKQTRFNSPKTGLQRMPGGYWMQREYRFAMQLPPDWKPRFAPHDKALLFASGKTHEVFTDNLLVLASPERPLDLERLQKEFPEQIAKIDAQAEVASCRIVAQGRHQALETVLHIRRGPFRLSILERRFRGEKRNYEVKFTCQSDEFERLADQLREAMDSFRELTEPARDTSL